MTPPPIVPEPWKPLGRTHNTRYYLLADDVLVVLPDKGLRDDGASARVNIDYQTAYARMVGRRCCVIVVIDSLTSQDSEARRIYAAGVSLGGNMLLKWLGEQKENATAIVNAAVVISAPLDLRAAVDALDHGLNKWVYTANFLRTMKQKSLAKIAAHGLPIDVAAVRACATLRGIDELCTAPIHGFANAEDYYQRSSSKPFLAQVRVPTLLLNARNDPFVPSAILPSPSEVPANVMLEFPENGGHVGFVSGKFPGRLDWLPQRIIKFLVAQC
jgi:predicted alpha/beta-fold hydrolase